MLSVTKLAELSNLSKAYISQVNHGKRPPSENLIKAMLDELKKETGLPRNPHTFRRTFACLLRKAGVDTMTIKDLGRWEALEMVQRYTRSVSFQDS